MISRPSIEYGVATCGAGCGASHVLDGLTLSPTGNVKRELLSWQRGRKIMKATEEDRGPRFSDEHAREQAEVRCSACSGTFWTLAPQAIEDARSENG